MWSWLSPTLFGSRIADPLIMTRNQLSDVSITSPEEFEAVLAEVVENAVESDIEVRGAWEFRTRGSIHEWEVKVIELDRRFDDD